MPLPIVRKSDLGVPHGLTVRKYMQPGEQEVLLTLIDEVKPRCMCEIGVNEGITAQAVLIATPSIEHYIGIDAPFNYRFEIPAQQSELPEEPGRLVNHDPRFELLLSGWSIRPRYPCGVVFIDGDHGRNAVRKDSILAEHLVAPGGMIIWHDYGNPTVQVTEVLDELHASGRNICHVEGTWLAFEWR